MANLPLLAHVPSVVWKPLFFMMTCVRHAVKTFHSMNVQFAVNHLALMIKISVGCVDIIIGKPRKMTKWP